MYHRQTTNLLLVYFSLQKKEKKIEKREKQSFPLISPWRTSAPSLPAHPTVTLEFVCSPRNALRTLDLVIVKMTQNPTSMAEEHFLCFNSIRYQGQKLQWKTSAV